MCSVDGCVAITYTVLLLTSLQCGQFHRNGDAIKRVSWHIPWVGQAQLQPGLCAQAEAWWMPVVVSSAEQHVFLSRLLSLPRPILQSQGDRSGPRAPS